MTKADRIRAFSLRCDGMTWEQIGQIMNYDPQTIAKDLHSVLEKMPRVPDLKSAALKAFLLQNCSGSVEKFAAMLGVSPYRLRRVIVYGDAPGKNLRCKILEATGLTDKEVFP